MEHEALDKLREQISSIDYELLILLKRRFSTAKKIAQYKQKNDIPIEQPDIEQEKLNEIFSKASQMNIDANFISELFGEIMDESKKEQNKFLEEKQK